MLGRTIKIHLVDGIPGGILSAEILGWTGKIIATPRSRLADLATEGEAKRTGVYVLAGEDPSNPIGERVYIGESDNVLERLGQHVKDDAKDFWTRTAIIVSKDENLTKAHVRYLESRLIQVAHQAHRATIANGTAPGTLPIPKSDIDYMESFLQEIQTLLPVLGFSFAQPVTQSVTKTDPTAKMPEGVPALSLTRSGVKAEAHVTNNGFIVLTGSTVRKKSNASLPPGVRDQRSILEQAGKLVASSDPNFWEFSEDTPFSSPSTAAAVIVGYAINGNYEWKVKETGQAYRDWQQAQIERAGIVSHEANQP